jgi:hypothetical protein
MEALAKTNTFMKIRLLAVLVVSILFPACTMSFEDTVFSVTSTTPKQSANELAQKFLAQGFRVKNEAGRMVMLPPEGYGSSFVSIAYDGEDVVMKVETIGANNKRPRSHMDLQRFVESFLR